MARLAARLRRLLARHPTAYWVAVVVVATTLALTVNSNMASVDATRAEWGASVSVWVATADLRPGAAVDGTVERRVVPAAIVPARALIDDTAPHGRLRQHVVAGEILTDADLTVGDGPLALVPDGWLAVPIIESPTSGAGVGAKAALASDGVVIAAEALVIEHTDSVTLVAVPADEAALVAAAGANGNANLTLLLHP